MRCYNIVDIYNGAVSEYNLLLKCAKIDGLVRNCLEIIYGNQRGVP